MATEMLSARQKQIYDFIVSYVGANGFPPTVREICDAVGLSSTATVHTHLKALEAKGYLNIGQSKSRCISVTGEEETIPSSASGSLPSSSIEIPLVGRVAAGCPILAEQNIEDSMVLPKSIVGDSASFMLQVRGESMIEAGIFDGDYVVVRQQPTADNGDIVVAMIDDSATVKTFYKEKDRIRLQPQNPTMDPIYSTDAVILGKVVALIRSIG